MEKVHRELIRAQYLNLAKAIKPQILVVAKYLRQTKLISDTMEEDIECQRTPSERAFKLLDIIETRGPKAFGILYDAVREAELWEAADLLEPSKAPHDVADETIPFSSSVPSLEEVEEDEPLPENWPTEQHMLNVENLDLKVKKVEKHQKVMIRRFQNPDKKQEYVLNQEYRGYAFIIDNETFTHGLSKRTGSGQDSKGLREVLQNMNFDVYAKRDRTKQQMEGILNDICRKNYTNYGCFILIILSHGVRGKVFGTDGIAPKEGSPMTVVENYVEIEEIKRRIAALDGLKGKPKLLIIQACQSDETMASDKEGLVQESSPPNNAGPNQQENSSANSSNTSSIPGVKQKIYQESSHHSEGDQDMEVVDLNRSSGHEGDNVDSDQTPVKQPFDESDQTSVKRPFDDSNQTYVKQPFDESDQTSIKQNSDGSDVLDGNGSNKNNGTLAKDAGDADAGRSSHEGSDMFIALATIEGQPSYRNTAFGSWFIQAFIYVLANYAHKHELSSLMRKVTQLVMKARSRKDESQVCERRSTMDKEFYFFPGLLPDSS